MAEADAHQPTAGPVFEPSRPDGAGVVGLIEIRDDLRQHGLTFSRVGDRRGPCWQICTDPAELLGRTQMTDLFRIVIAELPRFPELAHAQFAQGKMPYFESVRTSPPG